jgi:peptidoglycan/LPS O-acetylase OafA/YrhL
MSPVSHPPPTRSRLQFLDTLRGLASTHVVLFHMVFIPNPGLATPLWADKFAHNGGTGVTLFFIVSAFSLFYTMPFRLLKPRPVLNFYLHRFFRIAPLFYALIVVSIMRDHIVFGATPSTSEILANVFFIFNLIPGKEQSFVWAAWTIGVEMLFYVLFPLIYFRTRNIYAAISWMIGFLILWQLVKLGVYYLPIADVQRNSIAQWSVFKHLPIFACGAIAFFAIGSHFENDRSPTSRDKGHALLLSAAFGYIALVNDWIPSLTGEAYYSQGLVYTILLVGLCYAPVKFIVNRMTVRLGQISYSVYLIHPTVVYSMIPLYRRIYASVPTTSLALLTCFAMTLIITIAIAEVTYRYIEIPGIKLGAYVYRRWLASPAALEAAMASEESLAEPR